MAKLNGYAHPYGKPLEFSLYLSHTPNAKPKGCLPRMIVVGPRRCTEESHDGMKVKIATLYAKSCIAP